ncbi:MAG: hypothetical protein Q7S20_04580 [Gemmatimonadaceae bacterium]|nr:hypothetical protein [Gemmatimonadaceae bacterium]
MATTLSSVPTLSPDDPVARTLIDIEREVRVQLHDAMSDYVEVAAREHNLFIRCANAIAGRDLAPPAAIMLVATARVLGDLRVCQWAAIHGYALQAEAVAATVHELAYAAAYIGESETRAEGWLKHENEKRQYPESGHAAVLVDVLRRLTLSPAHAAQEYQIYRQLCLAKHGNPVVQRLHGTTQVESSRLIEQLPYFDENTLVIGRFGLFHAERAVSALLTVLLSTHLLESLDATVIAEFSAITARLQELGIRDGLYEAGPDGLPIQLSI